MRQLMGRLWRDDEGALIATEWVFVATILVIGSITGLVAVRQAILAELEDFAEAISSLSSWWRFDGRLPRRAVSCLPKRSTRFVLQDASHDVARRRAEAMAPVEVHEMVEQRRARHRDPHARRHRPSHL